jgi:DNA-binding MarR family transcriptional regulator
MNNLDLLKKLIRLRIATRRVCCFEDKEKKLISLKTKMLFLLYLNDEMKPYQLIDRLKVSKPNLTVLGHELLKEGLIEKTALSDKRNIIYKINNKGRLNIEEKLNKVDIEGVDIDTNQALDKVLDFLENM